MQKLSLPEGLYIRPSTPSDKPFLEKLHHSVRSDLQMIDGERDYIEHIVEMQYQAQTQGYGEQFPNAMYFIIEKHGEPVGKASLDFGANEVHLIEVAFLPQARGLGFGKAVIQSFQYAAAQAKQPLTLMVDQSNLMAKQLYLKLGFVVDAIQPPSEIMIWYPSYR